MAFDYNHRVHMMSDDMPSLHSITAAEVASFGYYMYHSGLNPPSVLDPSQMDPAKNLNEGSWSDPGTQNGMLPVRAERPRNNNK